MSDDDRKTLSEMEGRKTALVKELESLQVDIERLSLKMKEAEPNCCKPTVVDMDNLKSHNDNINQKENRSKLLSLGCKKFNMDAKNGIEFLVTNDIISKTVDAVAKFLYNGEHLNKTSIGDYLGEKGAFNEAVLNAFVSLHDFTDLILVDSLRKFLWSFRLPGEAQKIDRMMESFAKRYCTLNPDIFTNEDTCYVLSFSIIMLNTSLHNPAVKDKPTIDQYIRMNRGMDNGRDLPRDLLISLYNSIKSDEFKFPGDYENDLRLTFFNPDKEGWLWKLGARYKSWNRRWFLLKDDCLYYFDSSSDKEPRGIIPLENVGVREITTPSKIHCFEIYPIGGEVVKACKTDSGGVVMEGRHATYTFSAATPQEHVQWVQALNSSISTNPMLKLLKLRKNRATQVRLPQPI